MIRFLLTLFVALLVAAPAFAGKPWRGAWQFFDGDCTDLFDLDVGGNAPPAGAVDLTVHTNWDTTAEAYDLQLNIGAAAQVSGDPDGLCDSTPWMLDGSFSTTADRNLYIGPLWLPAGGYIHHYKFDAIVTDYRWGYVIEPPWTPTLQRVVGITAALTATTDTLSHLGPQLTDEDSSQISDVDSFSIPQVPLYLFIDLDGIGAWDIHSQFITYKTPESENL